MTRRPISHLFLSAALLMPLVACEAKKSSNPLSPSVAGPIAGVEITAPRLLEPAENVKIKESQQPITLLVENSSSNGVRPVAYTFEVASETSFATKLYARSGVVPGTDGRTRVTVDRLDSGRVYYWRVRADDGANSSVYSTAAFELLPKPQLDPPDQHGPINNAQTSRRPELVVGSSTRNAAVGNVEYEFHISTDVAFVAVIASGRRSEAGATTSYTPDNDLVAGTTYFWRVRASDGEATSSWSGAESFRTAAAAPGPGPGPGPSPTPGNGGSCASSNGNYIAQCIMGKYPQYLAAGVSHGQRVSNMEFLRDRMIEAGICGGMDLAWNLKRGVGPRSTDALAWRVNGRVEVVDIGLAFDDTGIPLQLTWGIVGGPPGYDPYPRPNCG